LTKNRHTSLNSNEVKFQGAINERKYDIEDWAGLKWGH